MHGGATNASTGSSTTTYHFQIQTPYFAGAVARFSAFFHCPLFAPICVAREVNAVNSENSKNQVNMYTYNIYLNLLIVF